MRRSREQREAERVEKYQWRTELTKANQLVSNLQTQVSWQKSKIEELEHNVDFGRGRLGLYCFFASGRAS